MNPLLTLAAKWLSDADCYERDNSLAYAVFYAYSIIHEQSHNTAVPTRRKVHNGEHRRVGPRERVRSRDLRQVPEREAADGARFPGSRGRLRTTCSKAHGTRSGPQGGDG